MAKNQKIYTSVSRFLQKLPRTLLLQLGTETDSIPKVRAQRHTHTHTLKKSEKAKPKKQKQPENKEKARFKRRSITSGAYWIYIAA